MARDVLHAKTGVFACVEERHALEVWQPAATEGGAFAKRAGPAGRVNGSCPNAATARAIGPNRVDWGGHSIGAVQLHPDAASQEPGARKCVPPMGD